MSWSNRYRLDDIRLACLVAGLKIPRDLKKSGCSWAALGTLLGHHWGALGLSGGRSRAAPGRPWAALDRSWCTHWSLRAPNAAKTGHRGHKSGPRPSIEAPRAAQEVIGRPSTAL